MKISKLEIQKRNKSRVNLYLDGEFFCGLSLETVIKNHLKEGEKVSQAQVNLLKTDSERKSALDKVMRHMSRTPKTEKELYFFLKKKEFEPKVIGFVLNKLKEYDLIDDALYAKNYVTSKSKKQGRRKIAYDLRRRGISEDLIDYSLQNFSEEKESIYEIAKKYLRNKDLTPLTKQKTYRYLASRGFITSDILSCLNTIFKKEE